MDKQLFDDAIGELPPSTVDVDAAIARGRRAARVRRLGNPVVAVTTGVVLVLGGTTMALLPSRGDHRTGDGPGEGRSGCRDMMPTAPALTELSDATVSRLTGALGPLVQSRLPAGSQLKKPTDHPEGVSPTALDFYHSYAEPRDLGLPGDCFVGWDHFAAGADVTRNGKTGAISVVVGRLGGFNSIREECSLSPEETYCDEQTGPNGEQIFVITLDLGDIVHEVEVAKPDGTAVFVTASSDPIRGEGGEARAMAEPPLTHQQLVEIALDPAMTLYPES